MTEKVILEWEDIQHRAHRARVKIREILRGNDFINIWGVPRGGIHAASSIAHGSSYIRMVEDPDKADIVVDDIIDSGETRTRVQAMNGNKPFIGLVDKLGSDEDMREKWVSFPWERMSGEDAGPEDNIRRILQSIGEDPRREGLRDTPARVAKSYAQIFSGYGENVKDHLTVFEEDTCDEMVILRDIEFYSTCEHHMLPFFGRAHIAYVPDKCVVGISKLARVLDVFARRLQIQERLTQQVTEALDKHLKPLGSACVLDSKHFCMMCRGVEKQASSMITSSLTGVFREHPATRAEFYSMIKS